MIYVRITYNSLMQWPKRRVTQQKRLFLKRVQQGDHSIVDSGVVLGGSVSVVRLGWMDSGGVGGNVVVLFRPSLSLTSGVVVGGCGLRSMELPLVLLLLLPSVTLFPLVLLVS